ncbi:hypothetical protein AQ824_28165 [Burkholderia pseudomallei]|nr:hypothetical protein AQ730_00500 [Burkholderia pseudomallei]OMS89876.1 hypothetical protein AQ748_04485 [Burkholderia pseudomallei]OMU99876.1 hypothetical protein AQ784_05330 [Burkholderia pseudomallei]OMV08081.1 hypothetical protein AQ785_26690 [Burkholderia pseudomallei]OMW55959.1 hypothetical protein AQ812_16200 [Burkholderia pseudomallei]
MFGGNFFHTAKAQHELAATDGRIANGFIGKFREREDFAVVIDGICVREHLSVALTLGQRATQVLVANVLVGTRIDEPEADCDRLDRAAMHAT